jgi:leucyl-tRNA synthetase
MAWPEAETSLTVDATVTVAVQVNGKLRATLELPRGTSEAAAKSAALGDDRIRRYVDGAEIRKVIYVPDKLISIVVAARTADAAKS